MRKETTEKYPLRAETGRQRYHVLAGKCRTEDLLPGHQGGLEIPNQELLYVPVASEQFRYRYAEFCDFASVGYLILTHDGLVDEINSTALQMIGVERKKILHHNFSVFVTAADVDHWHLFFSDVIKYCKRQNTWLTLKRSDDTEFSVQLDCQRVINSDKDPVFHITFTNVSGSILTAKTLREIGTHTFPMASSEVGSWDWDIASGRVIFNERWAKLHGYRLEEIEPHVDTWENGIHPTDFPVYQSALTAHLENLTLFFQAEYRIRTLSGPLVWILNRGTVIQRDSEGNALRMVGIEMDITERKRNENKCSMAAIAFES
jgi:PAS domain S-box-containing protein